MNEPQDMTLVMVRHAVEGWKIDIVLSVAARQQLEETGKVHLGGDDDAIELEVKGIPINPGVHPVAQMWINR